jgi:hypothetical protein
MQHVPHRVEDHEAEVDDDTSACCSAVDGNSLLSYKSYFFSQRTVFLSQQISE